MMALGLDGPWAADIVVEVMIDVWGKEKRETGEKVVGNDAGNDDTAGIVPNLNDVSFPGSAQGRAYQSLRHSSSTPIASTSIPFHLIRSLLNMAGPLSVEDILARQKAEKEAASKVSYSHRLQARADIQPRFLSKAERERLALEKRNAEVKAQQEREETEKAQRAEFEKHVEEERRKAESARYGAGSHDARCELLSLRGLWQADRQTISGIIGMVDMVDDRITGTTAGTIRPNAMGRAAAMATGLPRVDREASRHPLDPRACRMGMGITRWGRHLLWPALLLRMDLPNRAHLGMWRRLLMPSSTISVRGILGRRCRTRSRDCERLQTRRSFLIGVRRTIPPRRSKGLGLVSSRVMLRAG